jgi:hypothetical protein
LAYTSLDPILRHPVNSPALSAAVFLAPPEKTGCSLFAAVYRGV